MLLENRLRAPYHAVQISATLELWLKSLVFTFKCRWVSWIYLQSNSYKARYSSLVEETSYSFLEFVVLSTDDAYNT